MVTASAPSDPMQRARELAQGLKTFHPPEHIPPVLAEPAYLLQESRRADRPPVERIRILGLAAVALDRHFTTGVPDPDLAPATAHLLAELAEVWSGELVPLLAEQGVHFVDPAAAPLSVQRRLHRYFRRRVFPLLTPLAVDPGHPFPFISSFSLNFLVWLERATAMGATPWITEARIKVPRMVPRFVSVLAEPEKDRHFVWIEDLIRHFLPELFPDAIILEAHLFRVLRAELPVARTKPIRPGRGRTQRMPVVRLDVAPGLPPERLNWLRRHLEIPEWLAFTVPGRLGMLQVTELANALEPVDLPRGYAHPVRRN